MALHDDLVIRFRTETVDKGAKDLLAVNRKVESSLKDIDRQQAENVRTALAAGRRMAGAQMKVAHEVRDTAVAQDRAASSARRLADADDRAATKALQLDKAEDRRNRNRPPSAHVGVGARLGNLRAGVSQRVAAPAAVAVGASGVGIAAALDASRVNARLAAQLDATGKTAERAGRIAGKLYSRAYGESLGDVADAVSAVSGNIRALGRTSDREVSQLAAKTLNLVASFDTSSQQVTRTVGQLTRSGMAKDAGAAFDIITAGFQRGADKGGEFLDTLNEYSEPLKSLGIDAETFTAMLVKGAERGVYSVDKIGDAFKEFSIRAVDGSKATEGAYKTIGLSGDRMARDILKGGPAARRATNDIILALRSVRDPIKREQAGVALFGSMWEDIGDKAITGLRPAKRALGDVEGAAKRMDAALGGSNASSLTQLKREAEGLGRALGEDVLPPVISTVRYLRTHEAAARSAAIGTASLIGVFAGFKALRVTRQGFTDLRAGMLWMGKTRLGAALVDRIAGPLGGLRGRMVRIAQGIRAPFTTSLGKTGKDAGEAAARQTGQATVDGMNNRKGRFERIGKSAGKWLGRGFGIGAAAAIGFELSKAIDEAYKKLTKVPDAGRGRDWERRAHGVGNPIQDWVRGLFGGRHGGRLTAGGFRRFQGGGLVDAMVSPGEDVHYGGSVWRVPGARVAADTVHARLPVGAAVVTQHGQGMLARGASLAQTIAGQMPHFAQGGIARAAQAGRRAGWSGAKLVTGVAIAGPESGYNPRARLRTSREDSRGMWQINTFAHPWAKALNLYNPDVAARAAERVYKQAGSWRPWTAFTAGSYRGFIGRARRAVLGSRSGAGRT